MLYYYRIARGVFAYHFLPTKTFVIIKCAPRSGSTLLKALLAEGPDVSHLPEIKYGNYTRNKYKKFLMYYDIYSLSGKRIIVLKKPVALTVPFDSNFVKLKIIVLTRDFFDIARSMVKMYSMPEVNNIRNNTSMQDFGYALARVCNIYEEILEKKQEWEDHDIIFVKYEELIANPIEITQQLFTFIGSEKKAGVDSYRKPEGFKWKWGTDDGGEKIKTLKVQNIINGENINEAIASDDAPVKERALRLMEKLGY